jgi:hypothetical protein
MVQSVFVPDPGDSKCCVPVMYSLIDYDALKDNMADDDVVEEWNSFSPALKQYYRTSCKIEFKEYFQNALDQACTCDDRSWHGTEHDSACPVKGKR